MCKHTPAPWKVRCADWSDEGFVRYELDIVTANAADARLVAAAPDLLELCRETVTLLATPGLIVTYEMLTAHVSELRAAIAKATTPAGAGESGS